MISFVNFYYYFESFMIIKILPLRWLAVGEMYLIGVLAWHYAFIGDTEHTIGENE